MTESEWQGHAHPAVMLLYMGAVTEELHRLEALLQHAKALQHPETPASPPHRAPRTRLITDRKLRLVIAAWWRTLLPHTASNEKMALRFEETAPSYMVEDTLGQCLRWGRHHAGRRDENLCTGRNLMREVVGNPFRPVNAVRFSVPAADSVPGMRGWVDPPWITAVALGMADRIYKERDWAALPVLSDVLEDAGCDNDVLLRHLRGQELCWSCSGGEDGSAAWVTCDVCNPKRYGWDLWSPWVPLRGPHVRGCWALDLILEQEWT